MKAGILSLFGVGLLTVCVSASAMESDTYARKLFQRLTGAPLLSSDDRLAQMVTHIDAGRFDDAARIATDDLDFIDVTVRTWAAPMSNVDQSSLQGLNDMQALLVGVVRDEIDAREILTGNFRYQGFDDLNLPEANQSSNEHYTEMDNRGLSLARGLQKVSPQWRGIPEYAGALTSRAWAEAHMSGGTNRRALEYTFKIFMCTPIQTWRDRGLPDFYIRRDVDRAPGGDPNTFQQECRSCHAGMDALAGAYSRFDYSGGMIAYAGPTRVFPKMNQNGNVYPQGFVTFDDSWRNFTTRNHNESFGWRGPMQGAGINSFGQMMANSRGFSDCMTKKVFKSVCKREPEVSDQTALSTVTDDFESTGYSLKKLFRAVATTTECIEHPNQ